MTVQLNKLAQLFVFLSFVFLLQACGGGNNTPQYTISADVTNIGLSNEIFKESSKSIEVHINFQGDGLLVGFAPNSEPASWLNYRTGEVTENSATLFIDVVNAEFLPVDLYQTTLRLSTGDVTKNNLIHQDINVSLLIWQQLSFAETFGATTINEQSFEFTNLDEKWAASSDSDWLKVSSSFNSDTNKTTVTVTPDLSKLSQAGLSQGNVVLTGTTGTINFPVELGLDNIYLTANNANVAFTATKNINAISTTVTIGSNNPKPYQWQAETSAAWLTLTPNNDNNTLSIKADPTLAPNTEINEASIVISPLTEANNTETNSAIINETIQVSLYKSDTETTTTTLENVVANDNAITNAPLKPYLYVGVDNQLRVYHQYSGELLSTTPIAPENSKLTQFVIHPNGELLLAKADETVTDPDNLDENGNPIESIVTHRYKINLADLTFTEINNATIEFEPVKFVRFAGRYFVVTQVLEFADENLQRLAFDNSTAFFARGIQQASSTESLYAFDPTTSALKRFIAKVNDFTTNKISTELTHTYRPENLIDNNTITDFVVTRDEKNIYTISPTSEWISFDGNNFVDNGLLETNTNVVTLALTLSNNDRPHYLRFDQSDPSKGFYLNVYDQQQALTATLSAASSQPTTTLLSADNKRLIFNESNNEQIEIINLQQFDTSTTHLDFSTTLGNSSIASQTITLSGVNENWQATTNVAWLTLTTDNSGETPTLTVAINTNEITTWGLLTGTITIYDPSSDSYNVITVSLAVDEVRLSSNYAALAFNSLATQQTLTHTVDILVNRDSPLSWQASSNVAWLILTPDVANNKLVVTADASQATAGMNYAEITISSATAGAAIDGKIKVSLNKGSNDATTVTINNATSNTDGVALDPLRPYLYLAINDSIKVFNIIDGTLIATINSPLAGIDLTNLVIYPDGSKLLASNSETITDEQGVSTTTIHHYQIDLSNNSINEINPDNITIEFRPVRVVMIAGKPVIVTQTLEFADENLVRQTWDQANAFFVSETTKPASTNTLLAVNNGNNAIEQYQLNYNIFASQTITASQGNSYENSNFASGIFALASNTSGSDIYTVNSATEHSSFNGTTFSDNGLLDNGANITAFNVVTDDNDNSYFYRFDPSQGFVLTKYDNAQQVLFSQVLASGSSTNYLAPDYQRILSFDNNTGAFTILSMQ